MTLPPARLLQPGAPGRWLALLLVFRILAAAIACGLLLIHRVTAHDGALLVVTIASTALTATLAARSPRLRWSPWAWAVDVLAVFGLLCLSGDWRSPFYLLSLTTLALPAAALGVRRAVLLGAGYTVAFAAAARFIGPDPIHLGSQASVETLTTHLVLPGLVCFGVGYASDTLRRLERERAARELLAVEAERRRIAWELHDSAKQRVHAAHLLLSAIPADEAGAPSELIALAAAELNAAVGDMDTSLAELRAPLEGRPLAEALRERAGALAAAGPRVEVRGELPGLSGLQTAHAYRIAAEALVNAVRHAGARHVSVELGTDGRTGRIAVRDDGRGMPADPRPGSTGLLSMQNRTLTIGGTLDIARQATGGTAVTLRFPLDHDQERP